MVKKKLDPRIRALIEEQVQNGHRSIFLILGDKGKDQVVHLHYMLSKAQVASRPSILWCYKKELGFSSNKTKRMKELKRMKSSGVLLESSQEENHLFDRFLTMTDIRYCYYKESESILGQTFGMCVLQDFEALTPNLIARTIETVQGGGMIIFLLKTMTSLKQFYTMAMDVHSRYRTESQQDQDIVSRFNERFLLSLTHCTCSLILDDELNVLPLSSHIRTMLQHHSIHSDDCIDELKEFKQSFNDNESHPVMISLLKLAKTLDQAKVLQTFIQVVLEKSLKNTISLTAARGRGKSAAMGIAVSAAIAFGYANIFVTSPHPDNLKTFFEFLLKGFDALEYFEHTDYDVIQSTNVDMNKSIVRINIFKHHRQTIQYILPQDSHLTGQAELVVIDEAAAIPLPTVKKLLGSYLVFMASTIHGYEGTGRSLSLKLIQQLRHGKESSTGRSLKEVKLEEPIRYKRNDPVEEWLNKLLCLNISTSNQLGSCPHPDQCDLYYVNRDTLFSFHHASEAFLQNMMALYVSSHYKNTPNDLQLISDAPGHHLFVLLPRIHDASDRLPEILVVIQVCVEGQISKGSIIKSLKRGIRAGGDLIPWTLSQQFQDDVFAELSGVRVVRIATHSDYQDMGYGSRALNLLEHYYMRHMIDENEIREYEETFGDMKCDANEDLQPRKNLPPLLCKLSERRPETLQWIGVSFGLTGSLLKFWKRSKYIPMYLRQTANELTGENTIIMLKTFEDEEWIKLFYQDFYKRFMNLLSMSIFKSFPTSLALELLSYGDCYVPMLDRFKKWSDCSSLSVYDLKRLDSYASNISDYHLILDLVPTLAHHYFLNILRSDNDQISSESTNLVSLSPIQKAILLGIGLQKKTIEELEEEFRLSVSQILAIFVKIIKKFSQGYKIIRETDTSESLFHYEVKSIDVNHERSLDDIDAWEPTNARSLDNELTESGNIAVKKFKEQQRMMIDSLDLEEYSIKGHDEEWEKTLENRVHDVVSISSDKIEKKNRKSLFKSLKNSYQLEQSKKVEKIMKKQSNLNELT